MNAEEDWLDQKPSKRWKPRITSMVPKWQMIEKLLEHVIEGEQSEKEYSAEYYWIKNASTDGAAAEKKKY